MDHHLGYKFLVVGEHGEVHARVDADCTGDRDALDKARRQASKHRVEVWLLDRFVGAAGPARA